jgi:hypothetical protein
VFLTADRNLSHQQALSFDIAVLAASSNRLDDLRSLVCPTGEIGRRRRGLSNPTEHPVGKRSGSLSVAGHTVQVDQNAR